MRHRIVCLSLVIVCSWSLCPVFPLFQHPCTVESDTLLYCIIINWKCFYCNLQVAGSQMLKESGKPVKVAESDVDVSTSSMSSYSVGFK